MNHDQAQRFVFLNCSTSSRALSEFHGKAIALLHAHEMAFLRLRSYTPVVPHDELLDMCPADHRFHGRLVDPGMRL
jgi:hypothetical protein